MPTLHETAYPRLKSTLTEKDLQTVYTPTPEDVAFADRVTRLPATKVGLLVLLKTFQRLGLSIKAGRLTPSTILRRLGTYSRKNRVYFALRELGRAIRTGFLLQYLADAELRRLILRSMNKSELFNGFLRWVFFGGEGIIAENRRDEQRKIIKYNHLVANLVIFHNVVMMTKVLRELIAEGHQISTEALAVLSPYPTAHINRLGLYTLQFDQEPAPIEYDLPLSVFQHSAPLSSSPL